MITGRSRLLRVALGAVGLLVTTLATTSADDEVFDLIVEMSSPAALRLGTNVAFTYSYETDLPDGIRVYTHTLSGGSQPPVTGSGGANTHPQGSGTGAGFFTIPEVSPDPEVLVDALRLLVTNHDSSVTLCQVITPVFFHFNEHLDLTNITFDPESPAALVYGERVNLTYDYDSDVPEGIRIFPRPVTNGSLTPNYAASGSAAYVGSGSIDAFFTITGPPTQTARRGGTVEVDHVRFILQRGGTNESLTTFDAPVTYFFDAGTPIVMRSWGEIKSAYR